MLTRTSLSSLALALLFLLPALGPLVGSGEAPFQESLLPSELSEPVGGPVDFPWESGPEDPGSGDGGTGGLSEEEPEEDPGPSEDPSSYLSYRVPEGYELPGPPSPTALPILNSRPASLPLGAPVMVETQSAAMELTDFDFFHENRDPAKSLDHGENSLISVDVWNRGRDTQVMVDVEVDFYYLDTGGQRHFIGRDIVDHIKGNGGRETATVRWEATQLAKGLWVLVDQDGSDGGPAELTREVTVNPASYFHQMEIPYNRGSGTPGETVSFEIKVVNLGSETDTLKLSFSGEEGWNAKFEGGLAKKTLHDLWSGDTRYVEFRVDIHGTAHPNAMRVITMESRSESDDSQVTMADIEVFALRDQAEFILVVNDTTNWGGEYPPGPATNTTRMLTAALDDAGYSGMYHVTSSKAADQERMGNYDVVLWVCGYSGGLSSANMLDIQGYLNSGGAFWVGGSMHLSNNQDGMNWYGQTPWELYQDYFNVSYGSVMGHPVRTLRGVPGDPLAAGAEYSMNYVWGENQHDGAQDWADHLWTREDDLWAQGVFYSGERFLGVRNWWQKSTVEKPAPYRTLVTGFDLGQLGAYPEDGHSSQDYHGDLDRQDFVHRVVSWLGVSPQLPEKDLKVSIVDPSTDYIQAETTLSLNISVGNVGTRYFTEDFTVRVDIQEDGGSYSTSLSENVRNRVLAARPRACPDQLNVYLDWDVPAGLDRDYLITASIDDDGNNSNNEVSCSVTAKNITDIALVDAWVETRLPYWNMGLAGSPALIHAEFENQGSTTESFEVNIAIREPIGKEELRNWTFEVEDLAPGWRIEVSKIWTPKIGAGTMNITQSWNRSYTRDPYLLDMGAWDVAGDVSPGNNGIHSESPNDDNGGQEQGCEGIFFPVAQWAELAETSLSGWTQDASASREDSETRWLTTNVWNNDPANALWAGVEGALEEGRLEYDNNSHVRLDSPELDLRIFSEVRYDFIYGSDTEKDHDYSTLLGRYRDEEDDPWSDWAPVWNSTGNHSAQQGGYLNQGPQLANADGVQYQMRWIFHSDAYNPDHYHGTLLDGFILMAQAENYFTNDLALSELSVSPSIGEADVERTIVATVLNAGDADVENYNVHFLITNKDTGLIVHNETMDLSGLDSEASADLEIQWTPEDEGWYYVNVSSSYKDRWGENLDEVGSNDFRSYLTVVDYHFMYDNFSKDSARWSNGTADLDGSGVVEAKNDWERGEPDHEYGPQSAHSEQNCWGTNLQGNYGDYGDDGAYLQLELDLGTARKPLLRFWHWAYLEGDGSDRIFIRVGEQDDNGTVEDWITVWENPTDSGIYRSSYWEEMEIPLFDEEGERYDFSFRKVAIQFVLMSGGGSNYPGWYLDDVGIHGEEPPARDALMWGFLSPANHTVYPPGTLVNVEVKVSNVGRVSQNIPVNLQVERDDSNGIFDETRETGTLNPGASQVLSWSWHIASTGCNTEYYRMIATTKLDGDEHNYNDQKSIDIHCGVVHDLGILEAETEQTFWDEAAPRVTVVKVKNFGNVDEMDFKLWLDIPGVTVNPVYGDIYSGETKELRISWWPEDGPGAYELDFLKISLYDDNNEEYYEDDENNTGVHRNELSGEQVLISSITPSPAVVGEELRFGGCDAFGNDTMRYYWTSSIDGTIYDGPDQFYNTSTLSKGVHEIRFNCQNSSGMWQEEMIGILSVGERPVARIDHATPGPVLRGQSVNFTGSGAAEEGISRYQWNSSIDGVFGKSSWSSCHNLSVGSHSISFRVQSELGLWSHPVNTTLTVSRRPTAYILSINPSPANNTEHIVFSGRAYDSENTSRYVWYLDDKEIYNGTQSNYTADPGLSEGNYSVSFKVQSREGFWSRNVTQEMAVFSKGFFSDYDPARNPSPLFSSFGFQESPDIHQGRVVWQESTGSNRDIYFFDLQAPGIVNLLTRGPEEESLPSIYQGRVVWLQDQTEIYLYDLDDPGAAATLIQSLDDRPLDLRISGDHVLWFDVAANGTLSEPFALFHYNLSTQKITENMLFDGNFALDGSRLIYLQATESRDEEGQSTLLRIEDLDTGVEEDLLSFPANQADIQRMDYHENYLVWEDHRDDESGFLDDGNSDIYFLDTREKRVGKIAENSWAQAEPRVYGDHIVWADKRSGIWSVYAYSVSRDKCAVLSENQSSCHGIDIHGDYVVWESSSSSMGSSVYLFDLREANWQESEARFWKLGSKDPGPDNLMISITSPANGATLSGKVIIRGEAGPAPLGIYLELVYRVDSGDWERVECHNYSTGMCSWEQMLDTRLLNNGVHSIYLAARTFNASSGSMELVSDQENVTILVDNKGVVTLIPYPVWNTGDSWSWRYTFPESSASMTITETVVNSSTLRKGISCYQLEVWVEGTEENATLWLARNNLTLVDSDVPPDNIARSRAVSLLLGALDFPLVIVKTQELDNWTATRGMQFRFGSVEQSYKHTSLSGTLIWYAPSVAHLLKLENDVFSLELVETSVVEEQEESEETSQNYLPLFIVLGFVLVVMGVVVVVVKVKLDAEDGKEETQPVPEESTLSSTTPATSSPWAPRGGRETGSSAPSDHTEPPPLQEPKDPNGHHPADPEQP